MARSAPVPPAPPAEGGTYEVGKDGALVLVQRTADPAEVSSPAEPVITPEEPQADGADS